MTIEVKCAKCGKELDCYISTDRYGEISCEVSPCECMEDRVSDLEIERDDLVSEVEALTKEVADAYAQGE